jgi:multicomponent Na+:H+ antiporter subunit B
MQTLILRTASPVLCALMILYSVFITLRGHNDPGGGFIGGLIAVSAFAIYGISHGVGAVRRAMVFHPMAIAGFGLFFATLTGLLAYFTGEPFFTGKWAFPEIFGTTVALSTPMFFDIGVYFVVVGAITSIALALEEDHH